MKTLLLVLAFMINSSIFASVVCHTPRMNKVFEIKDADISFFQEGDDTLSRKIASIGARTKKIGTGFSKTLQFENQKHTITIKNVNQFSDVEDYIVIKDQTGHEITYPLICQIK